MIEREILDCRSAIGEPGKEGRLDTGDREKMAMTQTWHAEMAT
jgi:hypothetical protein